MGRRLPVPFIATVHLNQYLFAFYDDASANYLDARPTPDGVPTSPISRIHTCRHLFMAGRGGLVDHFNIIYVSLVVGGCVYVFVLNI